MPINWKDKDAFERLLAAVVAASTTTPDYRRIAHYFGQGASYDAIEGRFRVARKLAEQLKAEAGSDTEPSPRKGSASKPRKSAAHKVKTGRVMKNKAKPGKDSSGDDNGDHESGAEIKDEMEI